MTLINEPEHSLLSLVLLIAHLFLSESQRPSLWPLRGQGEALCSSASWRGKVNCLPEGLGGALPGLGQNHRIVSWVLPVQIRKYGFWCTFLPGVFNSKIAAWFFLKLLPGVMHHHTSASLLKVGEFLLNPSPCSLHTKPTKAKEYLLPEIPFPS